MSCVESCIWNQMKKSLVLNKMVVNIDKFQANILDKQKSESFRFRIRQQKKF